MIEKIPIVEMTYEGDVSSRIVRLPYIDIADIVSWVGERGPLAVIPPYSEDIQFTARAASYVNDRIGEGKSLVAITSIRPRVVKDNLALLQAGGFRSFALCGKLGEVALEHLFPVVAEGLWIHVAGSKPRGELAGKWSWSEEPL